MAIIEWMDFSDWINKKYMEWRGASRATISDYSAFLGVPQSLLSQWMKRGGKVPTSKKYVDALIKIYGNEVFTVLDLPRPINQPPENFRERLRAALEEALQVMTSKGIEPDSPEGERIIAEIADKYGLEAKRTTDK
jgi:hypothetical protein